AGNWMLVSRLAPVAAGPVVAAPAPVAAPTAPEPTPAARPTIALMPKNKGDAYFVSCRLGAEEAAQEANVELLWDGPTQPDASKQNEVVEAWITRGVDAIAVSVENQAAISTVLRKARQRGIKVVTWDADSEKDARDYFINQATAEGIGQTLMDEAARVMGERGEFAIISASLTASNQNDWIKVIRARLAERYPNITLKTIEPSDDKRDLAFRKAQDILAAHPNVKLIMAIAAPAVPGAAEAVQQSGRADVKVIGLSLPNLCRTFIKDGVVDCIVLWNTVDLGYLTVLASKALVTGDLQPGATSLAAGRLGTLEVAGDEVLLGKPFVFNASNIDDFDF
ncbi:MAG TPA: ABC transporter permease, partial [Armatimonadetes bacterium]|nr:ABC transporter permease [Armatimonadota bacterium]